MVGKLERVPLREVWKDEARDFTPWLQENIDVLNEVIDKTLSNVEREQRAGTFSVDLVAEDQSGDAAVIENQLERSNHDHLGKLITYAVAIGAKSAVWIVSDPRPEHVAAISWLNETSPTSFYLIKVEAVQIGDPPAAPLLTLIVGPSQEAKDAGATVKHLSESGMIKERFWTGLLDSARKKTSRHANITPGNFSGVGTSAGKPGLGFSYVIRQHDAHVELYVDLPNTSNEENKACFDAFIADKDQIEKVFGEPFEWQRLEGRHACRIKKDITIGGYLDENSWPEIHELLIDAMVRLERAFKAPIENLKI